MKEKKKKEKKNSRKDITIPIFKYVYVISSSFDLEMENRKLEQNGIECIFSFLFLFYFFYFMCKAMSDAILIIDSIDIIGNEILKHTLMLQITSLRNVFHVCYYITFASHPFATAAPPFITAINLFFRCSTKSIGKHFIFFFCTYVAN